MFEKEAEDSWQSKDLWYKINADESAYKTGFQDGYNKVNEWHFVKDGDLPTEDLRQRTRGYYLTASKYKWHKWFIFDVAYFTGVIFIKGGAILDSVIAWREIVPPMM